MRTWLSETPSSTASLRTTANIRSSSSTVKTSLTLQAYGIVSPDGACETIDHQGSSSPDLSAATGEEDLAVAGWQVGGLEPGDLI